VLEYPKVLLLGRSGVAFSAPIHHKNMWGEGENGDVEPLNFDTLWTGDADLRLYITTVQDG